LSKEKKIDKRKKLNKGWFFNMLKRKLCIHKPGDNMIFNKLLTSMIALSVTTCVLATGNEDSLKVHNYIGAEVSSEQIVTPTIGCRIQNKNIILDTNVSYYYIYYFKNHHSKVGTNLMYSFIEQENGQIYGGVGFDIGWIKATPSNYFYGEIDQKYFRPHVVMGKDYEIDISKKAFFEISYTPIELSKNIHENVHFIGMKMGIGF
jgi:hypothetical protein